MSAQPPLQTPTRTLVETSVGVRQAKWNLGKIEVIWEKPKKILIVTKPDKEVCLKSIPVLQHLIQKSLDLEIYIQDSLFFSSTFKKHQLSQHPRILCWNAKELRKQTCNDQRSPSANQFPMPVQSFANLLDSSFSSMSQIHYQQASPTMHSVPVVTMPPASLSCETPASQQSIESKHDLLESEDIDLIITLGGDGTVLYAAWLFQTIVPPILPFHLGTLGFLTVFDYDRFPVVLDRILAPHKVEHGLRIGLRMRLTCSVYRSKTIQSPDLNQQMKSFYLNNEDPGYIPQADEVFQILNDLVVDRGPSPYMSSLEVFGDGRHLTTVQADGLVVSTPTGSTAYSLSAGGSLVHPEVPSILLTPICPHTLSFRPMLLPDSMELKIVIPRNSRNGAWVSFDGRHRIALNQGDAISIVASPFSVPTLCQVDQTSDWFGSLVRCLGWNERVGREKSFVWGVGIVEKNCEETTKTTQPAANGSAQ